MGLSVSNFEAYFCCLWRVSTDHAQHNECQEATASGLRPPFAKSKSAMRTQIRKVREAVQAGDVQKAEQEFQVAAQKLDRAGASRVIHPNKAARLKSRMQRAIKKAKQAKTVA